MSATRTILAAVRASETGIITTDAELLRQFADSRDENAFEVLVRRHTSLVWGVCYRILGHIEEAEDAFQATFLVLARNPEKARRWVTTAGFLFGVARKVALKARSRNLARLVHLPASLPVQTPEPAAFVALHELQTILDDEIERLPEAYRLAFILCVLNGKSRTEAAAELVISEGTLSARLARARLLLRTRLAKRGVQLSAALAVTDLSATAAPPTLVSATIAAGVSDTGCTSNFFAHRQTAPATGIGHNCNTRRECSHGRGIRAQRTSPSEGIASIKVRECSC